jgi:hypothetical protein
MILKCPMGHLSPCFIYLNIKDFLEVWAGLCTAVGQAQSYKAVLVKLQRRELVRLSLLV